VLECALEENARRLISTGRREQLELTDPGVLETLHARGALLRPRQGELIELEVTRMAAKEAAHAIRAQASPAGLIYHRLERQAGATRQPARLV